MKETPTQTLYELVGERVRIFQRGTTWHANWQQGGHQHRKSLGTKSKKQARCLALKLEAEMMSGRLQPSAKPPTVGRVVEQYTQWAEAEDRAPRTLNKYRSTYRHVLALAATRRVQTIDQLDLRFIDAYRAQRKGEGRKPKTIHNETVLIRQLVNFALRRQLIIEDPLRDLQIRRPKSPRQPCWTNQQVEQILAAAKPPQQPALRLLADTGMRVGELKHLTWDDIDLTTGLIQIRPKEGWKPKTGDQRAVPISPAARAAIEALPRTWRWVVTAPPSKQFPQGGRQISERRLLQYLKRILAQLGLQGHLHTFRHAFISNALIQGTSEPLVREWVGHVDREVIRVYTHVAGDASQQAMARLYGAAEDRSLGKKSDAVSAQFQHNSGSGHYGTSAN